MDDDPCLLHRLPVGSGGCWAHRRVHLSRPRYDRVVPDRRPPRLSSAPDRRTRSHRPAYHSELSWRPPQRDLQNWTTFGTLILFVIFVALGVSRGSPANFPPLFTHTSLVSIVLVVQIVPYFMTGFESVGKAAEEAGPEFRAAGFFRAIWMAIVIGILFYTSIVAAVAFVAPWRRLTGEKFMTAVAFQQAVGSHGFAGKWIVNIILAAALLSLVKCFNGNFVAASRLVFALGRRGMVHSRVSAIHNRFQTPSVAVLCVGISTAACMLL